MSVLSHVINKIVLTEIDLEKFLIRYDILNKILLAHLLNHLPTRNYRATWSWALVGHKKKNIFPESIPNNTRTRVIYVLHSG